MSILRNRTSNATHVYFDAEPIDASPEAFDRPDRHKAPTQQLGHPLSLHVAWPYPSQEG